MQKLTISCSCGNKEEFDIEEYRLQRWNKKKRDLIKTDIFEFPHFVCARCFQGMNTEIEFEVKKGK